MSGHSKWATTKHKKAANDAKRGKEFAKLIKNIEVAARTGGGDPAANPTLDDMIKKAKKASVPNDNIERARKRGAGEEAGGSDWETLMYEGYGPNAPAIATLAAAHNLIVCVDCGTLSHDALAAAEGRADVIVLDHHQGGETLPPALAVVNPNRADEDGALGYLCAAGVVFLTLVQCNRVLRAAGRPEPGLSES